MQEYKVTVHKGGKIIIPAPIRKVLNIGLSDNLLVSVINDKVQICTLDQKLKNAQNILSKLNSQSLVDDLKSIRKSEQDVKCTQ